MTVYHMDIGIVLLGDAQCVTENIGGFFPQACGIENILNVRNHQAILCCKAHHPFFRQIRKLPIDSNYDADSQKEKSVQPFESDLLDSERQ